MPEEPPAAGRRARRGGGTAALVLVALVPAGVLVPRRHPGDADGTPPTCRFSNTWYTVSLRHAQARCAGYCPDRSAGPAAAARGMTVMVSPGRSVTGSPGAVMLRTGNFALVHGNVRRAVVVADDHSKTVPRTEITAVGLVTWFGFGTPGSLCWMKTLTRPIQIFNRCFQSPDGLAEDQPGIGYTSNVLPSETWNRAKPSGPVTISWFGIDAHCRRLSALRSSRTP